MSLDDADHLLSQCADAEYAASVLSAWADRYLPAPPVAAPTQTTQALAPGRVEVSESGAGKFTQTVRTGRHRLVADEPAAVGGDDAGPGPYDLLLAGLGACTSMTLRMYADRKQLPLAAVSVALSHQNVHADDCGDCETREGRIGEIHRTVTLHGALDDAQRQRLLEIADRCPVHRTLSGEIRIRTELEPASANDA